MNGWEPVVIGRPVAPVVARAPSAPPYRPDVTADGWSCAHFEVRCALVRGPAHRFRGEPRQDECAAVPHAATGALVAVVADGVSGAPLSHLGATMACRTVVDYLHRALDAGGADAPIDWADLLRHAGWSLVEYAARQLPAPPDAGGADGPPGSSPDPRHAERLLATTLVVALVRPDGATTVVRVGDSNAWVLRAGVFAPLFADPAAGMTEDGVLPDGVSALPRVPASVVPVQLWLAAGDVLVLATDGVADPLADAHAAAHAPANGGSAAGPAATLAAMLARELASPPPMLRLAWLLDFACGTYDDDRTLVGVWPVGAG